MVYLIYFNIIPIRFLMVIIVRGRLMRFIRSNIRLFYLYHLTKDNARVKKGGWKVLLYFLHNRAAKNLFDIIEIW